MDGAKNVSSRKVALIALMSAFWVILHLFLGPLGFQLFHLPILCDISAYLPLIITVSLIPIVGAASSVGLVGTMITLFLRPGAFHMLGFALAAVIFDILSPHGFSMIKARTLLRITFATLLSSYIGGFAIGFLFMSGSLEWSLTIWAPLHLLGGLISLPLALPISATVLKYIPK